MSRRLRTTLLARGENTWDSGMQSSSHYAEAAMEKMFLYVIESCRRSNSAVSARRINTKLFLFSEAATVYKARQSSLVANYRGFSALAGLLDSLSRQIRHQMFCCRTSCPWVLETRLRGKITSVQLIGQVIVFPGMLVMFFDKGLFIMHCLETLP